VGCFGTPYFWTPFGQKGVKKGVSKVSILAFLAKSGHQVGVVLIGVSIKRPLSISDDIGMIGSHEIWSGFGHFGHNEQTAQGGI
jgi:hypothetical protein